MRRVLGAAALVACLSCWTHVAQAQQPQETEEASTEAAADETPAKEEGIQWFAVPTFGTSPETGFYLGAVGLLVFPTDAEGVAQRTALDAEFQITFRLQIRLDTKFTAVLDKGNWILDTNLYLGLEPDYFYGIGMRPPLQEEQYNARRINTGFGFKRALDAKKRLFVGGFYQFTALGVEPGMRLGAPEIVGSEGGIISSPGIELNWDARDSALVPRNGTFFDVRLQGMPTFLGSTNNYGRLTLDARGYIDVAHDHVLAARAYSIFGFGEIPVYDLAMLGGENLLRGTYRGRYRDRNLWATQFEYRSPLLWIFRFNVFSSLGRVASTISGLNPWTEGDAGVNWTIGGGTRVKIDDDVYIRFDYSTLWVSDGMGGLTRPEGGFYISANEAF